MKESPNKSNPQEDIVFIITELLHLFADTDDGSLEPVMTLSSNLGSTFHARVLNAAKHLGMMPPQDGTAMFEQDVRVEWKSIRTAPRDGRWFILWVASGSPEYALCRWSHESNCWRVKNLPGLAERLSDLLDFNSLIVHRWIELEPFFSRKRDEKAL